MITDCLYEFPIATYLQPSAWLTFTAQHYFKLKTYRAIQFIFWQKFQSLFLLYDQSSYGLSPVESDKDTRHKMFSPYTLYTHQKENILSERNVANTENNSKFKTVIRLWRLWWTYTNSRFCKVSSPLTEASNYRWLVKILNTVKTDFRKYFRSPFLGQNYLIISRWSENLNSAKKTWSKICCQLSESENDWGAKISNV